MSSQTFTSSGTFTVPLGVNRLTIECIGAGGSGCSASVNGGGGGGGGGGGAYKIATVSVTAGATYTVTVGTGGVTGSGDGGTDGGDSVVSTPVEVRASGGRAAFRNNAGFGGFTSFTYIGGDGGNSTAALSVNGGGGGGAATSSGNGTAGQPFNSSIHPAGGAFGGGFGASAAVTIPNLPATDGTAPGGGGGGGAENTNPSGANGADGLVMISWTVDSIVKNITGGASILVSRTKTITGGAVITNIPQSGYNIIGMATAPPTGKSLQVTYNRLGQDLRVCENTPLVVERATVEGSTGKYQQLANDSTNINATAGLQQTQQALATYSTLPITIKLRTLRPGLLPGQYLTVDVRSSARWNLPAFLNGRWLVQQVDAQSVPLLEGETGGVTWDQAGFTWDEADFTWDSLAPYRFGPMIYTITLTNVPTVTNWVNDLERLAQRKA